MQRKKHQKQIVMRDALFDSPQGAQQFYRPDTSAQKMPASPQVPEGTDNLSSDTTQPTIDKVELPQSAPPQVPAFMGESRVNLPGKSTQNNSPHSQYLHWK